jgi:hypothetical protein
MLFFLMMVHTPDKQLTDHVQAILQKIPPVNIHVVCPYITRHAHRSLLDVKRSLDDKASNLFIHAFEAIPTVAESVTLDHKTLLDELYWRSEATKSESRGVTFFAHKVPNSASFPEGFARGTVFPGLAPEKSVANTMAAEEKEDGTGDDEPRASSSDDGEGKVSDYTPGPGIEFQI